MKREELFFEDLNFFRFFFSLCGTNNTTKKDDFFELVVSKKLS